jgi:hypothetical protein
MKLVDRNTYKIPTSKPIISEKGSPAQGVGLLEFSSDDSYVACRNGNYLKIKIICLTQYGFGTCQSLRLRP